MVSLKDVKGIGAKQKKAPAPTEKSYIPIFVPMGSQKGADTMLCRGKRVPVHTADIITRGMALETWLDENMKSGSAGAVYKCWLYAFVCGVLTVVSLLYINIYVAAVFAYLTGHFWGWRLLNDCWSLAWFKGKTLTYTP
jgi:hypothetical protein